MKRFGMILMLGCLSATVLFACGGDSDDASGGNSNEGTAESEAPESDELDRNAVLRIATSAAYQGWDPHVGTSPNATIPHLTPVYDRLVRIGGDGLIEPMLATSWEFTPDQLELTMELRTDVRFWDGTPFDAEVAKLSLERGKRLLAQSTGDRLDAVETIEVIDPATIKLIFSTPDPQALVRMAKFGSVMINPKSVGSDDISTTPAGSGPYIPVVEESDENVVVLERNEDYWDPDVAKVARLEIVTIADEVTRINAIRTGEVAMAPITPTGFLDAQDAVSSDPELELTPSGRSSSTTLVHPRNSRLVLA